MIDQTSQQEHLAVAALAFGLPLELSEPPEPPQLSRQLSKRKATVAAATLGSASEGLGQDITEYDIQLSKYVKVGKYYSFSLSSVRYEYTSLIATVSYNPNDCTVCWC